MFVTPNLGTSEAATYTAEARLAGRSAARRDAPRPAMIKKIADVYAARARRAARRGRRQSRTPGSSASVARLNAAGVTIALGDDTGIENTFFGYGEHHELELMVAAGMTPMQVIIAATRTPAEFSALGRLGTVAPGKSADFIVLDANPLDNIANTRKIAKVYQRGREVDRAAMRAAWTGRVAAAGR